KASLHAGCRKARSEALPQPYGNEKNVRHTNAATYPDRTAAVASGTDHKMDTIVTASVRTTLPVVAEEIAITLAITSPTSQSSVIIITDSQATLVWPPGHEFVEENRQAYAVARASVLRELSLQTDRPGPVPHQLSEILARQRDMRHNSPPPDKNLSREEAAAR
ncbi:hypothetical protein HPB47_023677, partial [Ixodes persulcatus]